jgi:hypothetical protein
VRLSLWKIALEEKDAQSESIDKWLKAASKVLEECQYDPFPDADTGVNLSVTVNEVIDIPPMPFFDLSLVNEFSSPFVSVNEVTENSGDKGTNSLDNNLLSGLKEKRVNSLDASKIVTENERVGNPKIKDVNEFANVVCKDKDLNKDGGVDQLRNSESMKSMMSEECKGERSKPYADSSYHDKKRTAKKRLRERKSRNIMEKTVASYKTYPTTVDWYTL